MKIGVGQRIGLADFRGLIPDSEGFIIKIESEAIIEEQNVVIPDGGDDAGISGDQTAAIYDDDGIDVAFS
jgi:hypothetical protein